MANKCIKASILLNTIFLFRYDLGKSVATGGSGPKKDAPVISLLNLAQELILKD